MLSINTNFKGQFNIIIARDKELKHIVKETGWQDNLITDGGWLNITYPMPNYSSNPSLASANPYNYGMRYIHLGTGSSIPAYSDTTLDAKLGGAGNYVSSTSGFDDTTAWTLITYQFGVGSVVGNISELACSGTTAGTNITTRALIRDAVGAPTTLTVTSDDLIIIKYKIIRTRWDSSIIHTGNFTVNGTNTNYTTYYGGSTTGTFEIFRDANANSYSFGDTQTTVRWSNMTSTSSYLGISLGRWDVLTGVWGGNDFAGINNGYEGSYVNITKSVVRDSNTATQTWGCTLSTDLLNGTYEAFNPGMSGIPRKTYSTMYFDTPFSKDNTMTFYMQWQWSLIRDI